MSSDLSSRQRIWRRAREKHWGLPPPPHLKHGQSSWAATVYGCSCQACLPSGRRTWRNTEDATGPKSATQRTRESRERLRGRPVPEGAKHGIYTARFYNCPCGVCRAALDRATHRNNNRWMYRRTRGHWSSDQITDRIWWPPASADPSECPFENCFHFDHKEVA